MYDRTISQTVFEYAVPSTASAGRIIFMELSSYHGEGRVCY